MIQEYKNPLLVGNPIMIHDGFISSMDLFCKFLGLCDLKWYSTSSDRCSTIVPGAIVTPATHGNHLVGHADDGNPIEKSGKQWTSKMMEIYAPHSPNYDPQAPLTPVLQLIKYIRGSNVLRWGGDFIKFDTVHVDDGINISNPARWQQIYDEIFNKKV